MVPGCFIKSVAKLNTLCNNYSALVDYQCGAYKPRKEKTPTSVGGLRIFNKQRYFL